MKKNLLPYFLLFFVFCGYVFCKDNDSNPMHADDNSAEYENSLTGLRSFSTLMVYFSENKETVDAINKIITEEMGSIATIKMIKPEKGVAQNAFWEGYEGQAFFEFQSDDLMSYENMKIPAIRYTLHVCTAATINKTRANTVVDAWRKDYFVANVHSHDKIRKNIEAYRILIKEFKESYRFYNPDKKPIFYLFSN